MAKLKLGPIEDEKPVKLTIELPAAVHRDLLAYARAHATDTGLSEPLPAERLVSPMVERFMASDRGFARRER
ncbi:DUF2274 domain-containing protein [Hephaestia sp. GCM10023244]|uniref:DUF2274 domain-containing protein n=1 Tax=unclassified Hephaestia TaxID=2631281 RepID=UPI002076EBC1|nr:DUF2274 domain-containing protein [Hephaestia sp. MAHUQ-44]MCM8731098.1 DUF2274 domain-containing protein [Hephaestia sp. MAHUQ-44]